MTKEGSPKEEEDGMQLDSVSPPPLPVKVEEEGRMAVEESPKL